MLQVQKKIKRRRVFQLSPIARKMMICICMYTAVNKYEGFGRSQHIARSRLRLINNIQILEAHYDSDCNVIFTICY